MTADNKFEEYRDLIELWVRWWDGPGRWNYTSMIVPPLTKTREALACIACCDLENEGARCMACGRFIGPTPAEGAGREGG